MSQTFDFDLYKNHELYHLRYGHRAVIVAIDKETTSGKRNSNYEVVESFNSRNREDHRTSPYFDSILSIKEVDGFVHIMIQFKYPSYYPINATIKRILPVNQVTLEVLVANDST